MKFIITSIFLFWNFSSVAQEVKSETLFAFNFEGNVKLEISMDTVQNSITLELTGIDAHNIIVTDYLNDTTPVFQYSYYLRGGGVESAGLDLNYLRFEDNKFHYEVYDHYSSEDDNESV